jgi:hypothetical protein
MNLDDFRKQKQNSPKKIRERRNNALSICAIGKFDVEKRMEERKREFQHQPGQQSITAIKPKRGTWRTDSMATFPVNYKLPNRKLYFYHLSPIEFLDRWDRGLLTDNEMQSILDNINLMQMEGGVSG